MAVDRLEGLHLHCRAHLFCLRVALNRAGQLVLLLGGGSRRLGRQAPRLQGPGKGGVGLVVDHQRLQHRGGGAGSGLRGRQCERHVLPHLAGALLDCRPAHQLQLRRLLLAAGGQARIVERRPRGVPDLVADGDLGIQRARSVDEHLHLGAGLLRGRQQRQLAFLVLDLAIDLADLDLGVEDGALGLRGPLADQAEQLAPVGLGGRAVGRRGPARQLGQVVDQLLLRLGGKCGRLQQGAIVPELLDRLLEAPALASRDRLVGARHRHPARVDRADLELGGRLGFDADGGGHGLRRQVGEQQRVLALLDFDLGRAGDLGAGRIERHGIDARGAFDLGGELRRLQARGK